MREADLAASITESQLIELWRRQLLDSRRLVTEDGEAIEIVYPGRLNRDRGADFQDAVIATGRGLSKGDIEVHVNSGDWQGHRHHRDAVYNRVVLHVVMRHNSRTATIRLDGLEVPVLALDKYLRDPVGQWFTQLPPATITSVPCCRVGHSSDVSATAGCLDRAGEERFRDKAVGLQTDITRTELGQLLY